MGPANLTVRGELIQDVEAPVTVTETVQQPLEVVVHPAGAIRFQLRTLDDEPLKRVKLQLEGAEGRLIAARWQEKHQEGLTTPRVATSATLGVQGVASRLKPGHYTLVGVSEAGYESKEEVAVTAGVHVDVTLHFRR